jgi:hypothetical protein
MLLFTMKEYSLWCYYMDYVDVGWKIYKMLKTVNPPANLNDFMNSTDETVHVRLAIYW